MPFVRGLVYPIFSLSRQDAKTAKMATKSVFLFLQTWRPLRLCGSSRGIPTRPRSSCSPEALFHRESHRLSDSLNPNSTENFKYLWIVFIYHEAHEDHEEFTIKLYPPQKFKPRGRYNLIDYRLMTVSAILHSLLTVRYSLKDCRQTGHTNGNLTDLTEYPGNVSHQREPCHFGFGRWGNNNHIPRLYTP